MEDIHNTNPGMAGNKLLSQRQSVNNGDKVCKESRDHSYRE